MSWNQNNNSNSPWGKPPEKKGGNPFGGGGGGGGNQGGGGQPPDFEELFKKNQEKFKSFLPGDGGFSFKSIIPLALLGILGYALTGVYIVKNDEVGIETVFGKFSAKKEPGLNYNFPYPIGSVTKPAITRINKVDIGMRQNANTRTPTGESLMLTGDENIVDIYFDVQWSISRAAPENYVFNLQSPDETIRAVGESAMREVVGRNKIQELITTQQQAVATEVKQIMQTTLDSYGAGVEVRVVQIQRSDAPLQVREAFLDVNAAQQDRDKLQNQAREYANDVVPRARGRAQQMTQEAEAFRERLTAEAIGEASRFNNIYNEYRKAPEITRERLFLENNAKILGRTDKIIIEQGGALPILPLDQLLKGAAK
jgi:membrane protease subunit HflK